MFSESGVGKLRGRGRLFTRTGSIVHSDGVDCSLDDYVFSTDGRK